ncbi:MAG TPA: 4Fe-4S binding protein [Cyclobacteriaceae bacterium]|nr:4Fe-4S binding protein [Cyclobacteriaceae bacterium]
MGQNKSYWGNIVSSARSLWSGLRITFDHIVKARKSKKPISIQDKTYFDQPDGIATIQYPHALLPVPDTGRYKLHNEIDDCIVCDKCVKICPVDCITIEPIRATEEIGRTSDGTPKRIYAARFDIDMGKCCFCGLCTTVCPTECLTMTKTYDFSVFDIRQHNFEFADMTPQQIEEKKKLFEEYQKSKTATPTAATFPPAASSGEAPKPARPVFKPKIKPPGS